MAKKPTSVRYSEKKSTIKYIETSEETIHSVFENQYEEIVRFQEISDDYWSNKYEYLLCCILIGTGNDLVPLMMKLAFQFSGGGLVLLLLIFSLLIGLPLIYMESFFGRYTRLTNCQMYRMTPMFFGVCSLIFLINVVYQPLHITGDMYVLVNLLKLLVNPNINIKCLDDSKECYDYKIKGPIMNETCKYGHISMICEKMGEIRYPMQYQYWKMFKDPTSTIFPYYQILTAVVITWGFILAIVMKRIQVLGSIVQGAFLIQIITLTIIYFLAVSQDGSSEGFYVLISLNMKQFDPYQIPTVLWYSLCRLGLLVPTGFMTHSAYAKFKSSIATECVIIVICSVVFAAYYLTVFFSIAGVLANAIGVNVESIIIPDRGLFLAVVPEFLVYLQIPNIFLIIYYGSLWFFETVKIALYVHMLILNLFDYFPSTKNFSTYIWVTSIIVLCLMSLPACGQYANTVFIPVIWIIYLVTIYSIALTLEATMVSYFYGVNRLCDDIHYMTGQKPTKFWRITWYLIPLIGWACILVSSSHYKVVSIETDYIGRTTEYGWLYINIIYWGFISITAIATIMHIIFTVGSPNLTLVLLKPHFYWGPADRNLRIDRKNFSPNVFIRSQRVYGKKQRLTGESNLQHGVLISDFSKDVLIETSEKGDVLNDKTFFENIGILSKHGTIAQGSTFMEEKTRELDIQSSR